MASKRHQRRRACEGKRKFATEQEALDYRYPPNGDELQAYNCGHCGWVHLGHQFSRFNNAIAASMAKRG